VRLHLTRKDGGRQGGRKEGDVPCVVACLKLVLEEEGAGFPEVGGEGGDVFFQGL